MEITSEGTYTITLTQEEAYQLDEQLELLMNNTEEKIPTVEAFYNLLPWR